MRATVVAGNQRKALTNASSNDEDNNLVMQLLYTTGSQTHEANKDDGRPWFGEQAFNLSRKYAILSAEIQDNRSKMFTCTPRAQMYYIFA